MRGTLPTSWALAFAVALTSWWSPVDGVASGDAPGWERIRHEQGVRVWRHDSEGDALVRFRGKAVVQASLAKVLAVISGSDRLCEWRANCVRAFRIDRLGEARQVVYYRVGSPVPFVKDRDAVVDARCEGDGHGGVRCPFRETKHARDPAPKDAIRMPRISGYWQVEPKGDGACEVTYELSADPGGAIPTWLYNLASKKLPYKALTGLKSQVKKDYSAEEARILEHLASRSEGS